MNRKEEEVIQSCREIPDGPLFLLTVHQDTVLHMATYSKQTALVIRLLELVPECDYDKLTWQNDKGNTILHEAATSDSLLPAAKKFMYKAPSLVSVPNINGEMAIFRAAVYGMKSMYRFLDDEMKKTIGIDEHLSRADHFNYQNTSILHASVLAEHFDLAFEIAECYPYLANKQDSDGMTALQLLSCNPTAFYYGVSSTESISAAGKEGPIGCIRVPLCEESKLRKIRYESAKRLAMFLVSKDTSWEETQAAVHRRKPKTHKYGKVLAPPKQEAEKLIPIQEKVVLAPPKQEAEKLVPIQGEVPIRVAETPLFLATKSGCTEIVQGILNMYPQAVEHVDEKGRNLLHVAIKYRQIQIFDMVRKMEIPMLRLRMKIDHNGHSILHMVGLKAEEVGYEDMRSPALILQEDLCLFERVKGILPNSITQYQNSGGVTAEKLFASRNDQLRKDAKEWMKDTAQNCSIVAVLIATVAFAAAYTIPGGPNQATGYPILEKNFFFVVFTMSDVLSLACALTSVIVFLSILTSPFRLKDFQESLPQKLVLGVTLLVLSVSMMMIAFGATVIILIRNNGVWTRIPLYAVSSIPVLIFAFSYLRLYISLLQSFTLSFKKVISSVVPRCSFSNHGKSSDSTIPSYSAQAQTTHSLV